MKYVSKVIDHMLLFYSPDLDNQVDQIAFFR